MLHTPFVFLLGGHDLEMLAIKQLLLDNGFSEEKNVADHNLQWGAKLSDYQNMFNDEQTFVGIELLLDIAPPSHYINIDHHNENSSKNSSLEQVIELLKNDPGLKIELTRDLQLIAANDKGYIPAMIRMGATTEEVADIRRRDREAQGVTEEDERLAEQSIKGNLIIDHGVKVVKSLTSKFSTITDRLYPCNRLLIYTDKELTIYGENVSILINKFAELSTNLTTYSGGGEHGYWGISGGNITKELINTIIKIVTMSKDPYSSHIFLFPFKFRVEENCNELFIGYIKEKWKIEIDETKEEADLRIRTEKTTLYNEKKYFHDFVHPVLFSDFESNNSDKKETRDNTQINSIIKKVDLIYRITIKRKKNGKRQDTIVHDPKIPKYEDFTIDLNLEKVTLDLYKEGIGVFSFHLNYFPETSLNEKDKLANILLINQYGRRIYPPFLDLRYSDFELDEVNSELEGTKRRELAESISIIDTEKILITENWNDIQVQLNATAYIPRHILYFLNVEELENKYWFKYSEKEAPLKRTEIELGLVLDDRMFVMSWLGAEQLTEEFQKQDLILEKEKEQFGYVLSDLCKRQLGDNESGGFFRNDSESASFIRRNSNGYRYLNNDFWYQYVFVDGGFKTCQNEIMQEQLLSKHTYDRWVGYNTLYGISRYSFVMLTAPFKELRRTEVNAAFIPDHLQTIYFRMVSLVLVQRSMVLFFSKKISDIEISIENEDKQIQKEALILYKTYRDFINKTFHREVTAQEQGIELYDMLQEHLRVEKQAKELEKEFDETYRLVSLIGTKQTSDRMRLLAMLGSIIVVPTFIFNLLKNRFFDTLPPIDKFSNHHLMIDSIMLIITLVACTSIITIGLMNWNKNISIISWVKRLKFELNWGKWLVLIAVALLLIYLLSFQFFIGKTI